MSVLIQMRKQILATPPGRWFKESLRRNQRFPKLMGSAALETLIDQCEFETVLDIGSCAGKHADILERSGKHVTAIDFGVSVYYQERTANRTDVIADYYDYDFAAPFDCVWASHVLEHQPNPNAFLRKVYGDLKEGGWLAITVPPLKHQIVGGHLSLWIAGLLLYQLVFAGFDCRDASVRSYGYNVSVIVRKRTIHDLPELHYDNGDIDRLREFFPAGLTEGFNGRIRSMNWPPEKGIAA